MKNKEKKEIDIGQHFNLFGKFLANLKKYGYVLCTYGLILFLILYSWIRNPVDLNVVIDKMMFKQEQEHQISIDRRQLADAFIPSKIEAIGEKYDLSRTVILESHNGSKSLGGLSFMYLSATYEWYNRNDSTLFPIMEEYQKQNQSAYGETLNEIKNKGYKYMYDLPNYVIKTNNRLAHRTYKNGANSILLIGLIKHNEIYGLLVLSSDKSEIDATKIMSEIKYDVDKLRDYVVPQ